MRRATAGSRDEHLYVEPDQFTAETPMGTYTGVTEMVEMSRTPGQLPLPARAARRRQAGLAGGLIPMAGTLYILRAHPAAILALDPDSGAVFARSSIARGACRTAFQVDGPGQAIYWTSMGAMPESGEDFFAADGAIERCDLHGAHHRVLVGGGEIVTPKQLQLDQAGGRLYWCDREGMAGNVQPHRRRRSPDIAAHRRLAGGQRRRAAPLRRHRARYAQPASLLDAERAARWRARPHLPHGGSTCPPERASRRAATSSCLIDHLPEPIDLEIDHERGRLYWTDRGDPAVRGNSVNRADISPAGLINHQVLAIGLKEGIGLALDHRRGRAFVGDLSGAIRVLPMGRRRDDHRP